MRNVVSSPIAETYQTETQKCFEKFVNNQHLKQNGANTWLDNNPDEKVEVLSKPQIHLLFNARKLDFKANR
jgi:hypothetical protein